MWYLDMTLSRRHPMLRTKLLTGKYPQARGLGVPDLAQEPESMFDIPCDLIFPCSHRNEVDGEFLDAQ